MQDRQHSLLQTALIVNEDGWRHDKNKRGTLTVLSLGLSRVLILKVYEWINSVILSEASSVLGLLTSAILTR